MSLLDPLLGKGYRLYIDNFYTSPVLADNLAQKQTDCVGTLRLNRREVPKVIKETKLKKGETVSAFRQKSMVLKWKDKKDVSILSTFHDNAMVNTVSRRGAQRSKPQAIANYNKNMGGVDLSDNLLTHYSSARNRLKKFYIKMFRHLLDMSVLNSYITYKKQGGKMKRVHYVVTLAENIVSKYATNLPNPTSSGGRPSRVVATPSRLLGRHFPDFCPPTPK